MQFRTPEQRFFETAPLRSRTHLSMPDRGRRTVIVSLRRPEEINAMPGMSPLTSDMVVGHHPMAFEQSQGVSLETVLP